MEEHRRADGKKHWRVVELPIKGGCEYCPPERRKPLGCGCSAGIPWTPGAEGPGHEGQARQSFGASRDGGGATERPYTHTCPQWFRRSPAVQAIMEELSDYEGGRLGPVDDMPAPLLVYLRLASAEKAAWENYQQAV